MKRSSSSSLQFFAAATASSETAAMSYPPPYRGGRNQCRRGFSGQSSGGRSGGGGRVQFVTGDSHFQSVRDANRRFRPVEGANFVNQSAHPPQPRPPFNPRPDLNPSTSLKPPPPSNPPPPFNPGFRPPEGAKFANQTAHQTQPRPPYNPRPYFNPSPSLNPPPAFNHNRPFRPPQQFRGRPPKPLDYRNWEFAKTGSPHCERFTILSYNILADYLAINHWRKLYFHIPPYMLEWEWRKKNIIFELGLWSADILCFQEVDRFQDLEEALKLRGYSGTWKMRTGDPVDGCAIFWRVSRFKLLHEECIEFNKLGLRDNVAQICVLELLNQDNNKDMSALPFSLTGSSKVVICNIHVLYNPKRGEIKLGQLRVLLDRAHAVSKLWDDAPVVLCGDFNCTPKSPLYNYISDQKLNLSDLPRDKLSGQASGEIRPPRQFSPNFRALSADITGGAAAVVDHRELRQSISLFDVQEQNIPESNSVNLSSVNSLSHHQCVKTELTVDDNNSISRLCGNKNDASSFEMTNKTHQEVDSCKDEIRSKASVQYGGLKESASISQNKGGFFVERIKDGHESTMVDFHHEDIYSNVTEMGLAKETREDTELSCKDEFHSTISASGSKACSSNHQIEGRISGAQRKDGYECTLVSGHEDIYPDLMEAENGENLYAAIDAQSDSSSEQSQPDLQRENESMGCDERKLSFMGSNDSTDAITDPMPSAASTSNISSSHLFHETSFPCIPNVSTMGSSENLSSQSYADDKHVPSTLSKVNVSYELKSIDYKVDEKMENLSLKEHVETNEEDESFGEDSTKFLSELHDENGSLSSDFSHTVRSNFVESDKSFEKSATIAHSRNEVLDGDYPRMDSEPVDAFRFAYDPSAWTPMEIETATGNTDRTLVEHQLKLRSTYAEVEDYSGTRDLNGEPLVTSYNRCFIGTVDYIWRSEGLQTVRVLAPIPKHVMQQTPGFPTKKWGSDHIALVSELGFVKDDGSVQNTEAS